MEGNQLPGLRGTKMKCKQLITIGVIILFSDTACAQTPGLLVSRGNDYKLEISNNPTSNVFLRVASGVVKLLLQDSPDEWTYPRRGSLLKRWSANHVNDTLRQLRHGAQAQAVERYDCRFLNASPSQHPKEQIYRVTRTVPFNS